MGASALSRNPPVARRASALAGIEAMQGRLDTARAALAELRERVGPDPLWRTAGCVDMDCVRTCRSEYPTFNEGRVYERFASCIL